LQSYQQISNNLQLKEQIEKLIEQTENFDLQKCYIYSLIAYAQCNTKHTFPYLNKSYQLAIDKNYEDLAGLALQSKAIVFQDNNMYDSLVVTLMQAKNHFEKTNNLNELVAILHTTGDLYYNVGLYDEAKSIYETIRVKKGNEHDWKSWREVVVNNNLGLIEIAKENYDKAIEYFNKSIELNNCKDDSPGKTRSMGYIQQKLAACYLKKHNDQKALYYYNQSLEKCLANKMYKELVKLYYIKSQLLFNKNELDSSLYHCQLAETVFKKHGVHPGYMINIYKQYSLLYEKMNNHNKALHFNKVATSLNDSLEYFEKNSRYMQMLAEQDYNKATAKIDLLELKNNYLLLLFLIGSILGTVIIYYFLRLQKSYSILVKKNIESVGIKEYTNDDIIGSGKNNSDISPKQIEQDTVNNNSKYKELVDSFIKLIENEKLYLNKDITIIEIAEKLDSNRTYLSTAINMVLNETFIAYVNEQRIKEAVRKISTGKFVNMTLEGIASEVGFNNRNTFTTVFKKYTGVLPSYFIKEIKK
jgi:AraC-like DNA-binding protein